MTPCACLKRHFAQLLRCEQQLGPLRAPLRSLSSSLHRQQQQPRPKEASSVSNQAKPANAEFVSPRSALYVNGAASQYTPFILDPYLDFSDYFSQIPRLEFEVAARRRSINVGELSEKYQTFRELIRESEEVEALRQQTQLGRPPQNEQGTEAFESYLTKQRRIRTRVKEIQAKLADMEYNTVLGLLQVPTWLHEDTPRNGERKTVWESGEGKLSLSAADAQDLWKDVVQWTDDSPNGYFLLGPTAELELRLISRVRRHLEENGFAGLSGPHMLKAVVQEAAGTPFLKASEAFMIDTEDSRSSEFRSAFLTSDPIQTFATYLANSELKKSLPFLKFHHSGRVYRPRKPVDGLGRLLYPVQTQCVSFCTVYGDAADSQKHLDASVDVLRSLYSILKVPSRMLIEPADKLGIFESIRYTMEVWSSGQNSFVPCGYVSSNRDFISRRVRSHVGKKDDIFTQLIHGSAMDLTPFVACFFEHNNGNIEKRFQNELKEF